MWTWAVGSAAHPVFETGIHSLVGSIDEYFIEFDQRGEGERCDERQCNLVNESHMDVHE